MELYPFFFYFIYKKNKFKIGILPPNKTKKGFLHGNDFKRGIDNI